MFIKETSINDKPRERAKRLGFTSLTTAELIALIIRSGSKKESVLELSYTILNDVQNLSVLKNYNISELNAFYGMGDAKTISLLAALELATRFDHEKLEKNCFKITNPELAFKYLSRFKFNKKQEEFYIICLNTRKEVIDCKMIFKGTIDSAIIHPREIFHYILEKNSSYVIIAHNHPSRHLEPSKEDIQVTKKLINCGSIFNIPIIDHIIFSDVDYMSLKQDNYI
ncbi:MAG: RadC family protein [Bacilli bacterium]